MPAFSRPSIRVKTSPPGILPNSGELVFLQMDGDLSQEEFKQAWDYNMDAAQVVHKLMVEALKGGDSQ